MLELKRGRLTGRAKCSDCIAGEGFLGRVYLVIHIVDIHNVLMVRGGEGLGDGILDICGWERESNGE